MQAVIYTTSLHSEGREFGVFKPPIKSSKFLKVCVCKIPCPKCSAPKLIKYYILYGKTLKIVGYGNFTFCLSFGGTSSSRFPDLAPIT